MAHKFYYILSIICIRIYHLVTLGYGEITTEHEVVQIKATARLKCSESVVKKYHSPYTYGAGVTLDWCVSTQQQYGTVIGKKWGPMTKETRDTWTKGQCTELLLIGKVQTCYERWGWPFFEQW